MANRFTQTDKWKDIWFRKLSVESKLLFQYLCDNCDIAGFWEIDFERTAFETGLPLASQMIGVFENTRPQLKTIEGALEGLNRCYLKNENTIWIKNFLRHQKNLPLNPENKCHQGILNIIRSHNSFGEQVLKEINKQITDKGLRSPSGIGNGKGNIKGIVKGKKKLWPIAGKNCCKKGCALPAVYRDSGGTYDNFYCAGHMPEKVKKEYE
jgi:hypothetical protein